MKTHPRSRAFAATALAAVAALLPAVPAGATHGGVHTVKGLSKAIYTEKVTEEYRVPTRHGTLYGLVIRPVVPPGVTVPVILTYSPYHVLQRPTNNASFAGDALANYYVPRGYARAYFDLVGTRESSGCYDFGGIRERESGADLVDFLGTRPWSNGRVGMIGASYDGTTAYAVAVEGPKHLTTIVPQVAIDRWYDYPYDGGVRRMSGFGTPLLFDYGFGQTPSTDHRDPMHFLSVAASRVNPCERAEHQVRGYGFDPVYDAFWDERDYRARVSKVEASALIEGGWLDGNVQPVGSIRFFQALPDDHPKKLVLGQWGHATPDGSLTDWRGVRHAWFDYWLLDYDGEEDEDGLPDTGVMDLPRVDSQINTKTRFQYDTFPPEGTSTVALSLTSSQATGPTELALLDAGDTTYEATDPMLTDDRMMQNDCDDTCLVFLGPPLATSVRLSGTPFLDLVARSTNLGSVPGEVSTQYTPQLFVELPGGQRVAVTDGFMNSRNRNGERVGEGLVAGSTYRVSVEMSDLDYELPAGSRIGVAISSQQWMETLAPDDDVPAVNTILTATGDGPMSVLRIPISAGHSSFAE